MSQEKVWTERVKVQAEALRDKVEELIREGNVRRVIVKNSEGQVVMELPLTIGVVGAVAAPMLAAVGAMAGVAARWSLEIERRDQPAKKAAAKKSASTKSSAKQSSSKKTSAKKSATKKSSSKKSE